MGYFLGVLLLCVDCVGGLLVVFEDLLSIIGVVIKID